MLPDSCKARAGRRGLGGSESGWLSVVTRKRVAERGEPLVMSLPSSFSTSSVKLKLVGTRLRRGTRRDGLGPTTGDLQGEGIEGGVERGVDADVVDAIAVY